jgi:hypothetical protein
MRRALSTMVALAVPVLFLAGPLAGAPEKGDKDADKNTPKMIEAGQVVAKIMNVYEDKKKLRVQVTQMVPKYNQGAAQALANAQIQLQQAMLRRPPDYNQIRNLQIQMAQNQAKLITYEQKNQDLEIQATDEVVVRANNPPEQFDDKGKVKKYTAKELAELKGDNKKLPGYKAEFSDLQPDMIVRLHLVKKKDAPKPVKKPKDAEIDVMEAHEPSASMIVIMLNPSATGKK